MALYAFDGTWQEDSVDEIADTNVVRFRDAYIGAKSYWPGVGTRWGWFGRLAGGITGAGGRRRVKEALQAFERNAAQGDTAVDVVGFSRGAAIALHFANSLPADARLRFVGLFDTVPSFGIPGNGWNLRWKLGCPPSAERVFHAMALDENRLSFPLYRPGSHPCLTECWFRGVHSDIGGGNGNTGLSSIVLDWMFASAHRSGLNLHTGRVLENRVLMNPAAPPSTHALSTKLRKREPQKADVVHPSVATM